MNYPKKPATAHLRQRVDAFLAASHEGDFGARPALLGPRALHRNDAGAVRMASPLEARGAPVVAKVLQGRAEWRSRPW